MTDIEECRRTGLLKNYLDLETYLLTLKLEFNINEGDLEKYKLNIRAFMDQEEKLLNGNKGKHALFYNGALWRMSVDEINLIKSFEKDLPDEISYCDIIGGYNII